MSPIPEAAGVEPAGEHGVRIQARHLRRPCVNFQPKHTKETFDAKIRRMLRDTTAPGSASSLFFLPRDPAEVTLKEKGHTLELGVTGVTPLQVPPEMAKHSTSLQMAFSGGGVSGHFRQDLKPSNWSSQVPTQNGQTPAPVNPVWSRDETGDLSCNTCDAPVPRVMWHFTLENQC